MILFVFGLLARQGVKAQGSITYLSNFDERGNLTNTLFADGTHELMAYDAENRKISMTDRAGRTTIYTNDPLGRLTATQMPDGAVTRMAYDAIGREIATVDELNNTNRFDYDPNCGCSGRKADVIDPLGHVTHYTYDEDANQKTMLDALGRTVTYIYDGLDRPVQTIFPDGTKTLTTYDAVGRRIAETDQNTNTTFFAYDALGRLVAVTNALGKVTSYGYDEMGSIIAQTDANQHTTTFEYDDMGRRTKRTLPGNQVETYAYDLTGNLTNKVDFNGHAIGYAYDSVNRLLTKVPDASFSAPPVAMTYTATGQRATMSDASGTTTYFYNSRDWLTNKAVRFFIPGGARYTSVMGYNYDLHGNVTHISSSDPNGVDLGYTYDPLNRLENVADAQSGTTTYGYDDVGNLAGYVYPNNVSSTYVYDSLNRLTNLMSANAQLSPVAFYRYTVAAGGQRLTANENVVLTNGVRTINRLYSYDATYRLTHEGLSVTDPVALPATAGVGYTLDDVGNRLARQSNLNSILSTSSSFDANDRLTSDTYDANGNTTVGHVTTTAPTVSDQYDFEDRLINRNSGQITLTYDGDGNRVSKTVGGITTLYLVDDRNPSGYAQVLEEYTSINSQQPVINCVYTYGHTLISQDRRTGNQWTTSFYGYDGHNNVRYLTDVNGNVTDTYDYDAFGNLTAASGDTVNCYLFTGEQLDLDLGLYYLRARYHNPNTGRFWTQDSYEGNGSDPASLHKYTYCGNNPANCYDPSGHETLGEIGAATAIASGVTWGFVGALTSAYSTFRHNGDQFGWNVAGNAAIGGAVGFAGDTF